MKTRIRLKAKNRIKAASPGFDTERRTGKADMEPRRLRRCETERARLDDEEVL